MRRQDIFDRLSEYCHQRYVELGDRQLRRPMLKSYVVETSRVPYPNAIRDMESLGGVSAVDDGLFAIRDRLGPVGYLESVGRFLVLYTLLKTSEIEPVIQKTVRRSSALDSMWLANPVFRRLLTFISGLSGPHRVVRIGMEAQHLFEIREGELEPRYEDEVDERLSNRMLWTNRLGEVQRRLSEIERLQEFRTVSMLRMPASTVPGGHEFYYNGKVTNRSEDFLDHRNAVMTVISWYEAITDAIEREVWLRTETTALCDGTDALRLTGGLVVFRFDPPLPPETLERFVEITFLRGQGPFRLWGNPITRGKNYYHVHGLDLHLVQRIFLELSPARFLLLLPEGTCGNTVHRLLTNIQRYLTSDVTVTVGGSPYSTLIEEVVFGHGSVGSATATEPSSIAHS